MRWAILLAGLLAQPAVASSAPRILDCAFTTECDSPAATCTTTVDPILSFALVIAQEGETARYEGDATSPPMQVDYTEEGVLLAYDPAGPTLTSVGADGAAVHSSNLILLAHDVRAAQWIGTCRTR
ncbi:MAG: hypothetical protein KDK12_08100 [Rhodobacteraceae bacterium]|nr:hypothetical protein [Paracoccaceae bacterium]